MKIAIASDHAGFQLKEYLKTFLEERGISIEDFGTHNEEPVDYTDMGSKVAEKVSSGEIEKAILICATGVGMSVVANKYPRVRAALVYNRFIARMAKEHNDANILVLGGKVVDKDLAKEMVIEWLEAKFIKGRHKRRVEKIEAIEERLLDGFHGKSMKILRRLKNAFTQRIRS